MFLKRFLICLLFAVISILHLDAQIQRRFFGYSFGSSKQAVLQGMKGKGYAIQNTSEGFMAIGSISEPIVFGGYAWEWVNFKFNNNKLFDVSFCITTETSSSQIIIQNYIQLTRKLDDKYAQLGRDYYNEQNIQWFDSHTGVICRYMYIDSDNNIVNYPTKKLNMYLWYYDIDESNIKRVNDETEL